MTNAPSEHAPHVGETAKIELNGGASTVSVTVAVLVHPGPWDTVSV
jgi:hypothetical protein